MKKEILNLESQYSKMKFNAIILGTDHNSYSVARSFYDYFNIKPLVVGAGRLIPFYKSEIAEVFAKENFSTDPLTFVDFLNEIIKDRDEEEFIFFAPSEAYVKILMDNSNKLNFNHVIPYPKKQVSDKLSQKKEFYKILDDIKIAYPKTVVVRKDDRELGDLDGEIFIKADDYDDLLGSSCKNIKKGYHLKDRSEAIKTISEIYDSNFQTDLIAQEFINGGQGSEYSLNGYRSADGKVAMVLARNLLSDLRPKWVGNHLVQIDEDNDKMYDIAKKIVDSINYCGLFNIDFKVDSKTGKIYVLEMNIRQGRTFYYSTLAGVNLIKIATEDLLMGKSCQMIGERPFELLAISMEFAESNIEKDLLGELLKDERVKNSAIPIVNPKDKNFLRDIKINKSIKKTEDELVF